ncbi:MAG: hypothetical protein JRG71_11910 [Deltaproteobacteria bacterium]|nr:hypothetical protein [Deltaproteobacteria bacterium]
MSDFKKMQPLKVGKRINFEWPDLDRELTLREKLDQARPREQVEILRLYAAEQLNFIWYEALEAEGLVNSLESGNIYYDQFDLFIEQTLSQFGRLKSELEVEVTKPAIKRDGGRQKGCSTGGVNSGIAKREENAPRDRGLIEAAKKLLETKSKHEIVSILIRRDGRKRKQITTVLQQAGVLPPLKKRKKR